MQKQHELLKRMVEQREQLRALQGRQKALMAMQESAEQVLAVIEDTGESAGQYRVMFVILRVESGIDGISSCKEMALGLICSCWLIAFEIIWSEMF